MEFDQLSLFDDFTDLESHIGFNPNYASLDNDGKIYSKIDWLTVIFFDSSMSDVLRWLRLENSVSEFSANGFESSRGYDQVFKFFYNGILIETSAFNFYGMDHDAALFDIVVPKIRLDLSGSALDFLRSIGVNMDTYRFVEPKLRDGASYHFSRADFAFDFVNYQPGFVDVLIDFVNANRLPSLRVPLASSKGAISCEVRTGSQKTVYLGSPQSDSLLRVYDKRLQYIDPSTNTYKLDNPYGNPDSWFRIEWQTRNKNANNLARDCNLSFLHILRLIFDRYAFADGTVKRDRQPVEFWLKLFPWHEVESRLVQNADFVQFIDPRDKVVSSVFSRSIRSVLLAYSILGRNNFLRMIRDYLSSLYNIDPLAHKRLNTFLCLVNECQIDISDKVPDQGGLFNNSGRLDFSF